MRPLLPLNRTASLADFSDCDSIAVWQQCLGVDAYQRWLGSRESPGLVLCFNWGASHFRAPGHDPIYRSHGDPIPREDDPIAAVFALSVLDRIDAPMRFLRSHADRLLPGGLLVCTFSAWDADGTDVALGYQLRKRIYDRDSWRKLLHEAKSLGLQTFGGVDLHYHGHTLGDHTLATLVVTKGRTA